MNQPKTNIPPKTPVKANPPQDQQLDQDEMEGGGQYVTRNVMPSWLVSFLAHVAVILILALCVLKPPIDPTISVDAGQAAEGVDDVQMNLESLQLDSSDALESVDMSETSAAPEMTDDLDFALPQQEAFSDIGEMIATENAFEAGQTSSGDGMTNETSGRTGDAKRQALLANGGNQGSEEAVQLALKWIVAHQLEDGSWDLDHTIGPGDHRDSPNPGARVGTRFGATALALLPLLGAGHTHLSGEHKKAVHYGLEYLKANAQRRGTTMSFMDAGGMYSHGLCAIAINEAYAMTEDPELQTYAQASLWFTENSQDKYGGGWRYVPRERGDTSAVGWQIMALKSGKISGLSINPKTLEKAAKFLDTVSDSPGSFYGYMNEPAYGTRPANARTAVGLLCRMYMGWDREVPGLVDGMEAIAEEGPSIGPSGNMYYNYYATQAMKHMYLGTDKWKSWNRKMRDFLVESQSKKGNSAGSWYFGKDHAARVGGRLYVTSMACMTLEVYYRFLPLYSNKATEESFELLD